MVDAAVAERAVEAPPRRVRHADILAPRPAPLTAIASRRAWRALFVLIVAALVIQPISVPAGRYLYSRTENGEDVYTQWQQYAARPAPDVLFFGPSEGRTDVATAAVASRLSEIAGRTVTVEAIGVGAAQPALLDLVMYRVMARPDRPRVVVITLEAPMFNANGVCRACGRDPMSRDVWELSDTLDPGFYSLAMQSDPNRAALALGLAIPAYAYYPAIAGFDCPVVNKLRTVFQRTGGVPVELQQATPCEIGEAAHPYHAMTKAQAAGLLQVYRTDFIGRYTVSPQLVDAERDLVRRAQAGGAQVLYLAPPFHSSILAANVPVDAQFHATAATIAAQLGVPVLDLSTAVPDDAAYWYDPLHLNAVGAQYFAPALARALSPRLGASTSDAAQDQPAS